MTIWQHVPFENEAAIGQWARLRKIPYRLIRCWENAPLEADDLLVILGGSMSAYDDVEFLHRDIEILPHLLTTNLAPKIKVFHWHGDTFDLPKGCNRIATNDAFENQAFATPDSRIVATQFHFETTAESMNALLDADGSYLDFDSPYVDNASLIREGAFNSANANKALFDLLDQWVEVENDSLHDF